jgi:hypothetical protein
METKNILLIIAMSIILTIIIVALTNVGLSIFQEQPAYEKFCNISMMKTMPTEADTQAYNNEMTACNVVYNKAMEEYNQIRFYVLGIVGVALVLIGLLIISPIVRWTGLLSGGILLGESVVMNFANKIAVFVALIIILALISLGVWRLQKKEFEEDNKNGIQ